jgi:glycosyltransferase involved in cell wall biosynthesis
MMHGGYSEIRMSPQLIEALVSLPAHIRLVMTGKPQTRDKVDDIFDQLGLAQRVLRLPRIGFDEMLSYTVNADAAVLLYQNSDLGNFFTAPGRLTEYLICGLPLLASNHTGLENLVLRFQAGETADSTEPRSIAAAITRLERGVRQNSFPRARMRSIFDQHLAFDHWEPVFAGAFEQMLRGGGDHSDRRPPFPWLTSS